MKSLRQLWRIAIAFLISIALNGVLLTIDFSIDPRQSKLSGIQDIVVALLRPAEALTMWVLPGHGGAQILAMAIFSVLVYSIVAWVAVNLPLWWRQRM